jgi:HlyD family secretion protein
VLVNVGTQVSGTVKALRVDFNDHVKQNQVLLELDPALLQAQVRQSEANVASAEASLTFAVAQEQRRRTLLAQESVAKQDYDQALQALHAARAQLLQARAQLAKDNTNLAYATIRSPVSGVVVDRQVDVGQTVAASFQTPTLFRIAQDLRKMQIDSSFAEADIGNIKIDQRVHFNVDAFANRSFEGRVRQIRLNATVQQNVVTYDVVVAVENPEEILMPGMTAYVNILVGERKNVLLVPNAALRFKPPAGAPVVAAERKAGKRDATRGTVYGLEGQQLKPIAVETGLADSRYTEVVAGDLKAGDRVVIEDLRAAAPQTTGTLRMRMF